MNERSWSLDFVRLTGWALLLLCAASGLGGCGDQITVEGAGSSAGNITFDPGLVALPESAKAGDTLPFSLTIDSQAPKYNVAVTLDLVPVETGAVYPNEPDYEEEAETIFGSVIEQVPAGSGRHFFSLYLPENLPEGDYAVVVHLNRNDVTPEDDHLQSEAPGDELDNSKVVPSQLRVDRARRPNLRFLQCQPVEVAHDWDGIDPVRYVSGPGDCFQTYGPLSTVGDMVPIPCVVEVQAQFQTIEAGQILVAEAKFPGDTEWHEVLLRSDTSSQKDNNGLDCFFFQQGTSLPELRVGFSGPEADDPTDATVPTDRQGIYFDVLLPYQRFLKESDCAPGLFEFDGVEDVEIQIRCLLDPYDFLPEEEEAPLPPFGFGGSLLGPTGRPDSDLYGDNVCEFTVVVLAPDRPPIDPAMPITEPGVTSMEDQLWAGSYPRRVTYRQGEPVLAMRDEQTTGEYFGRRDRFGVGHEVGIGMSWRNQRQDGDCTLRPALSMFAGFGRVHVDVLGRRYDLLDARGGVYYESCGTPRLLSGYEVRSLGVSLWSKYNDGGGSVPRELFSKSREKEFTKRFMIGPVPVSVTAGVRGTVKLLSELGVGPGPNLYATVGPQAILSGYLEAGLDAVIFAVGVGGELEVLELTVELRGDLVLPCPSDGAPYWEISVPWRIRTLDGRLYVWVKYPSPTWSNPLRRRKKEWDLVEWSGIDLTGGVLWDFRRDFPVPPPGIPLYGGG